MFEFLKKKKVEKNNILKFVSPAKGKTIPLSEVPDPVFAQKMAGDGLAIIPEDDIIVAPVHGEISLIFGTKHAFAMTLENGIELLIHIGLETVSLNGEGFEQLVEIGTKVKAGMPIIKVNKEFIKSKGCLLTTMILITNPDKVKSIKPVENIEAIAGKTIILECEV